ncbi:MAG: tRNA pseudouridine(55) synthase TruB [Syntrophomonadaceae bacterium]|nr:tRNA pseudouridine(55) synthase TruB [Syntrophomonadaceae bacterium]
MDGFLNINKAPGLTSFDVIRRLKKIIPKTKLGHLGTLDPMAEGVLPVAVGFATRVIEYVADTDKVYLADMTLGGVSDTQDAWGRIEYQPVIDLDQTRLLMLLAKYTGTISQIPPMYSAVHHHGERLYALARQGITVERAARQIVVHYLNLLGINQDEACGPVVSLEIGCSQGSYIRTLCHDIGAELGTGAYMSALTRTRAGAFTIDQATSLEQLDNHRNNWTTCLYPVDFPLQQLPQVVLDEGQQSRIRNGNQVAVSSGTPTGVIRVYDQDHNLAAIARCDRRQGTNWLQPLKVAPK